MFIRVEIKAYKLQFNGRIIVRTQHRRSRVFPLPLPLQHFQHFINIFNICGTPAINAFCPWKRETHNDST